MSSHASTTCLFESRAEVRIESSSAVATPRAAVDNARFMCEQSTEYAPQFTVLLVRLSITVASSRNWSMTSRYSSKVLSAATNSNAKASGSMVNKRRCGSNSAAKPFGAMDPRRITTCTQCRASAIGESSRVAADNTVFFLSVFCAAPFFEERSRVLFFSPVPSGAGAITRGTPLAAMTNRSRAPTAICAMVSRGGSNRAYGVVTEVCLVFRGGGFFLSCRFGKPRPPSANSSEKSVLNESASLTVPSLVSSIGSTTLLSPSVGREDGFFITALSSPCSSSSCASVSDSTSTQTKLVSIFGTNRVTNTGACAHIRFSCKGSHSKCSSLYDLFLKNAAYSSTRLRTRALSSEACCVAIVSNKFWSIAPPFKVPSTSVRADSTRHKSHNPFFALSHARFW
mmetsp:Transcript_7053/g.26682  ORF Transcript_7053/g.26682 Transcript_7053/m.26682 type:complete len:398 (-) Transcript_7053:1534-2727(-)